ncbi:hypothetical protein AtDm6_2431 [Acetobacter tropicalis]|uniref:Uncharacterized protein n=1 Tax=Acetobacter tropicalis TaxID=104102 RepID=A0A094YK52_9PROT|nr:hypothetical protein AtDm6_2431 [Acetobacter tropicalis]
MTGLAGRPSCHAQTAYNQKHNEKQDVSLASYHVPDDGRH